MSSVIYAIFIAVLVLEVLIFVHEMGHFLAAKACGVYVDRFSLGMPPRVFGFKWGETDYCIGLLLIGGYVKMAGQEDVPQTDEEREDTYGHVPEDRWFNKKARWQRAIILFAGPFMNFVLAFVVFAAIAAFGRQVPLAEIDNRAGLIEEGSPASEAPLFLVEGRSPDDDFSGEPDARGWQTGDRLLTINGTRVNGIEDIAVGGVLGVNKTVLFELERTGTDGVAKHYFSPVEPKILDDSGLTRFGIRAFDTALVSHVLPGTPAEAKGLTRGDIIERANGVIVDANRFSIMVKSLDAGETVALEVRRGGELIGLTLQATDENRLEGRIAFAPPLHPLIGLGDDVEATVVVDDGDFTRRTGLAVGDVIKAVNGEPATGRLLRTMAESYTDDPVTVSLHRPQRGFGWIQEGRELELEMPFAQLLQGITGHDESQRPEILGLSEELSEAAGLKRGDIVREIDGLPATAALLRKFERERPGETLSLKIERPAILKGLARKGEELDAEISVTSTKLVGVVWGTQTVYKKFPPGEVIPEAFDRCYRVVAQIGALLSVLIRGEVEVNKALGGPVMIVQITTMYAQANLMKLLDFMAILSINLGVINLLPVPVLDGGQLMFIGIEAIRRKPVSVRVTEMVQQLALLFLIGFFVYVTFNDLSRLVTGLIP